MSLCFTGSREILITLALLEERKIRCNNNHLSLLRAVAEAGNNFLFLSKETTISLNHQVAIVAMLPQTVNDLIAHRSASTIRNCWFLIGLSGNQRGPNKDNIAGRKGVTIKVPDHIRSLILKAVARETMTARKWYERHIKEHKEGNCSKYS